MRSHSSTTTWPFSTFTPVPSRPRFSTLPVMPIASTTRSTSISLAFPSTSILPLTPPLPALSPLTLALVWILMPRFSNCLRAAAEISSSSTGSTRSSTSTTITSAPMWA